MSGQREWHVAAVFDTQEQAKQAAQMLQALQPREYLFVAVACGRVVWQEQGEDYGAADVRV